MKQISSAEAFRELNEWNKVSRVTLTFARKDAATVFVLRDASIELQEPNIFVENGGGQSMMHFGSNVSFAQLEPAEVKEALWRKVPVPPTVAACLRATFGDGDFCFLFRKR